MLDDLAYDALRAGCGTAVQLGVAMPDGHDLAVGLGVAWPGGPIVTTDTPFDLASLTKAVATTPACMVLVDRGLLDLDAPVSRYLPEAAFGARTVRELLGHRAGLPAWAPWFEAARQDPACAGLWPGAHGGTDRDAAALAVRGAALATPGGEPGARCYSDLGFLALGWVVEAVAAEPLDAFVAQAVLRPLGMQTTGYRRLSAHLAPVDAPATGVLRPREPAPGQEGTYVVSPQLPALTPGEVDDDHAWALDGVAGHAGLFGTAPDLLRFARWLLEELDGAHRLVRAEVAHAFVALDPAQGPPRSLGFDRPAREGSSIGARLGHGARGAVGHLGFTGTSLWIDLDARLTVALLTNRTYPSRTAVGPIRAIRPRVHDEVARWVLGG